MKKKTFILISLQFLLITNNLADGNKSKSKINKIKSANKNASVKVTQNIDRPKRATDNDDDEDRPFWANRGKKMNYIFPQQKLRYVEDPKDPPFWGNRGRRQDSSSLEDSSRPDWLDITSANSDHDQSTSCIHPCLNPVYKLLNSEDHTNIHHPKERREESSPFWGARGRRTSDELDDNHNKVLNNFGYDRQENDIQFWGSRGRREDDLPFWGNRGRRQDDSPFWGARGRREESSPFWGARGRREDELPFWGNRGRRDEDSPFWGNRGRRDDGEPFWGSRGRRQKETLIDPVYDFDDSNDGVSRLRRDSNGRLLSLGTQMAFWNTRGRDSKLKHLFSGYPRNKFYHYSEPVRKSSNLIGKHSVASTLYDDRAFAEEPKFILVERSSRSSSAEDDPYYISRGKKKTDSLRDRRGIIEEIVKSVKSDPYYIARGKKNFNRNITPSNSTDNSDDFSKVKELVCSAIEFANMKNNVEVKREVSDNDRDRRTILKKLAAQLQMDPYYVSRGKKSGEISSDDILEFIKQVSEMCE